MVSFERTLVVGASSGIGEALALALADRHCKVALVARRADRLEAVAEEVRRRGGEAHVFVHDVRERGGAAALFAQVQSALGGLDALIYAAGLLERVEEGEFDPDKSARMLEVNLLSAVAWCDLAAARFQAQRSGTLIGISSIAGVRGRRGNPVYGASKAGLTAYLEALRNRVSRYGVNVVTIKPGYVDTDMLRGQSGLFWVISPAEAARQILKLAGRGGSPESFVPARWGMVAAALHVIPSAIFRRLNF